MALPKYENTGTISVSNGATAVTGVGTIFNVLPADCRLTVQGFSVRIASVESNTALTLAEAWPGTSLSDDPYEIAITYDGPEFQLTSRQLLEELAVLLGGSTGQILTKASSTPMAVSWVDPIEEVIGTWTPSMKGATTAGSPAFAVAYGIYRKLGKLVWVLGQLQLSASGIGGMSGALSVINLPFPVRNVSTFIAPMNVIVSNMNLGSYLNTYAIAAPNTSEIRLGVQGSNLPTASQTAVNLDDVGTPGSTTTTIYFSGFYLID